MKKLFFHIVLVLASLSAYSQAKPDTLKCATNQVNGDVLLTFALTDSSCGAGCTITFTIFYATAIGGPYSILPSALTSTSTSFTHVGANGGSNTYFYYIEKTCNCPGGITTAYSDTLDNLDPVPPVINFVSVNGNSVDLSWTPSVSPETVGYIIYYVSSTGQYFPVDTVWGHNTSFYNYLSALHNPNVQSVTLAIASVDGCNTVGLFTINAHHTILLATSQDRCLHSVTLTWNNYINWAGGVDSFKIFAKINGGSFTKIQSLTNTDFTYTFNNVHDGDMICYYVTAYQNGGRMDTSNSNISCVNVNIVQPPAYNLFQTCTDNVTEDAIILEWKPDTAADLKSFNINHGTSAGSFSLLANVPYTGAAVMNYTHSLSDLKTTIHYYEIIAIDSCDQPYLPTTANNIVLQGSTSIDNINHLTWNDFKMDNATVVNYEVLRSVDGVNYFLVTALPPSPLEFYDDIRPDYDVRVDICYKIRANYSFSNTHLPATNSSLSNEWCGTPFSKVFIPNSIFPDGNNKLFRPIITFPDFTEYRMEIFNRWGEKIFLTEDYNTAWNGSVKNGNAPAGNYTYIISFKKPDGKEFIQQGNVIVVY